MKNKEPNIGNLTSVGKMSNYQDNPIRLEGHNTMGVYYEVGEVTDEMFEYFKDRKPQLDICLTAGVFDKPPHDLEGK